MMSTPSSSSLLSRLSPGIAVAALAVAGAAFFFARQPSAPPAEQAATGDRAEMEAVIRDYLIANPEVIAEAIRALQRREVEAEQERLASAAGEHWEALKTDAHSPVVGPGDAPVTVVEFYDYRCSFCRRAYPDVAKLLETYEGDIRYVFKQFPVLDGAGSTDGVSHTAARAAVAAAEQDPAAFRQFHDRLMRRDGQLTKERVFEVAAEAGLDLERLRAGMEDSTIDSYLSDTLALARRIGVTGTPTYVINGRVLAGAQGYEAMEDLVERGLQGDG